MSHREQIIERGRCVASVEAWRFFSEEIHDQHRAQDICAVCDVRAECLHDAVVQNVEFGVWGGVIFWDGIAYLKRRGRGRPRKDDPVVPVQLAREDLHQLVRSA